MVRIGIDVMGGDLFPDAPLEGAVRAAPRLNADDQLVLVGDTKLIRAYFEAHPGGHLADFTLVEAPDVITMTDNPARAIKTKPTASLNVGMQLIKAGELDAFVSAGNTGAVLTSAVLTLGPIGEVIRPTVGAVYPHTDHPFIICDVGANIDCKPEHLVQFAQLGTKFMQAVHQIESPRVALLNIGEEPGKGNAQVLQAHTLMKAQDHLHFVGNIEGWDLFRQKAEVLICDGFVGNIMLKFIESLYTQFHPRLPDDPELEFFNFETIGGLPLLGIRGHVIVGHGISTPRAFESMIINAQQLAGSGLIQSIHRSLQS